VHGSSVGLCVSALCEQKVRQQTERANAWPNWKDYGLVFSSRIGTPMEPDNLRGAEGPGVRVYGSLLGRMNPPGDNCGARQQGDEEGDAEHEI
jgi:hypothetical protein